MRFSVNFVAAFALAATFAVAATVSASAECKRYGFSVNDYGKDGPTNDAKSLLDKLIASKMQEKGVTDFHTGKKSVSCELFLNFIVFDEHTCTAEATVCWGGSQLPGSEQASTGDVAPATKAASDDTATETKPAKKKATKEAAVHLDAAAHTDAPAPVVHKTAAQAIPDPKSLLAHKTKKAEEKKEASASPGAASAGSATVPVETGSLSEPTTTKPTKHKSQKAADGSAAVAPIKEKSDDAGYPTPLPPSDGAQ